MFESLAEKIKKYRNNDQTDVTFKSYEEAVEPEAVAEEKVEEPAKKPVAPMVTNAGDAESNIELKVVRPASFEEVSTVADYLLEGCTVVLNMEAMDRASTLRMLDFLNGVTYTTGGDIKPVAQSTYIITPHNVDVSDEE